MQLQPGERGQAIDGEMGFQHGGDLVQGRVDADVLALVLKDNAVRVLGLAPVTPSNVSA